MVCAKPMELAATTTTAIGGVSRAARAKTMAAEKVTGASFAPSTGSDASPLVSAHVLTGRAPVGLRVRVGRRRTRQIRRVWREAAGAGKSKILARLGATGAPPPIDIIGVELAGGGQAFVCPDGDLECGLFAGRRAVLLHRMETVHDPAVVMRTAIAIATASRNKRRVHALITVADEVLGDDGDDGGDDDEDCDIPPLPALLRL